MTTSEVAARWRFLWLVIGCVGVTVCAQAEEPVSQSAIRSENIAEPGKLTEPVPYSVVPARPDTGTATAEDKTGTSKADRNNEWVIAPIPGYSPGQGGSLAVVGQYIFRPEGQSASTPPSIIGLAGLYTAENSYAFGAGYRGSLLDDEWRVQAFVGQGKYNYDFYGVGQAQGSAGIHVPLEQQFTGVHVQAMKRIVPNLYFGPRLIATRTNVSIGEASGSPFTNVLSAFDQDINNTALGLRLQWDTRDDTFYPTKGQYIQSRVDWYRKSFGGDFNFQIFDMEYNQYMSFGNHDVLAVRGYFKKASDGAPFFMLSSFGGKDLRGYEHGRYRDNDLIAVQAEWRHQLSHSWAVTGFAGVGSVAPSVSNLFDEEALWSYGAGLRYRLAKHNKMNFRLDWARGRDGDTLYFSVGEAF